MQGYIERRRKLVWDDENEMPADENTFLTLMARLGLYKTEKDAKYVGDVVELSLRQPWYGGMIFGGLANRGKITIGQSKIVKKTAI